MRHQVYYLLDPETLEVIYIGRTCNFSERLRYFMNRTGITPKVGIPQRLIDFERACLAEVEAIKRHTPKFNIRVISTKGFLGCHSTKGIPKSEATKQKMRKPKSEETKRKMRKPKSPEHRAKLAMLLISARAQRFKSKSKES